MTSSTNYTGLILVTGASNPSIEGKILETLKPFAIQIIDKQSMDIRHRYFLAVLISLDRAHSKAIEIDLKECADSLGVDLAIDYQDS